MRPGGAARRQFLLTELSAGFLSACLTLPLCLGAGILAFGPLGPEQVARGALAGLTGAIAGGLVAGLARRSSFVVTFPTTPIAAIQASLAATLLPLGENPAQFVLALAACLALAGAWQALFAVSGFSRLMRFVPHPVMAGFVSGVAVLIGWNQLPALLGLRSFAELWRQGPGLDHPAAAAFGLGVLGLTLLLPRVLPRVPRLLAGLAAGGLAFHLAAWAWPGADLGATIGAIPSSALAGWWRTDLSSARAMLALPGMLQAILAGSLTLAVVGTLDTFFALRTAQFIGDIPVDPRRDVLGQGLANVVAALVGGVAVSTSLSVSMANHQAGGRTRLSTMASAGTLLLGGILFPRIITLLPLVVIAAVLVAVAIRLVDRWSFQVLRQALDGRDGHRRRRAVRDALVIVTVFLATVLGRPVAGVATGVGLSALLFVLDMSRPVVARRRGGATLHSKRLRLPAEQAALQALSGRILLLELQGALFFGNAQALAVELEAVEREYLVVILDGRRLRELDTSGLAALDQAVVRFRKEGRRLLVSGAGADWVQRTFTAAGSAPDYVHPSLEEALGWAEDHLLAGRDRAALEPGSPPSPLPPLLGAGLALDQRFELVAFGPGATLCRAGDDADRLWILRRGRVRVQGPRGAADLVLARLGPGSTVGEIGFMEQGLRSATVIAEEEVEAWVLSRADLSRLLLEEPAIGQAVLTAMAGQLARRLRETSDELGEAEPRG